METAQNKMTKETLGQLIIDSEETIYHIAKSLLYNDADCADAIQEAIVKAFAKLHTLKDDSYAKTWLIRIVMNECYAIMRKEKKIISLQDYQMNEQETESKDYSDLYEAIFHLPEQIKLCVTLYYMEGYSVKEVAALLDTTESAVKNRLKQNLPENGSVRALTLTEKQFESIDILLGEITFADSPESTELINIF